MDEVLDGVANVSADDYYVFEGVGLLVPSRLRNRSDLDSRLGFSKKSPTRPKVRFLSIFATRPKV